ncbi:UDP-N-acetylmuramoyl-tripeptide--D-alanyl-D-alanine ligase [Leucobacter sp. UCMA 4100]|uniref:UDP-N-acetylmuramoyl-tripeptide--D-alanyl-D- alanine ligase n=1 Tax=Leucobacter sp. UCMA 4100 TaxID=2810534 RepID=UPI0022EB2C5B|nr:UDP-N-acetylmuramoyl-tripeptide--D-alanyl-D-alanine ligase [Leucobacter sp. UCMA 4100]MDA3148104.1 UDP-N-acetylmuramoyl-tripeptide--D-alanyl-D-alanine ligase [Leucobacter sp. UCMA 4100]
MITLTLAEIATAVNGTLLLGSSGLTADATIDGISQTDSREVGPGQIFFARRGEETDGHRFVEPAVERGAALLVVERDVLDTVPQVVVSDATDALAMLATEVLARVNERGHLLTVGVTGSNGKTTTKNLLQRMAETVGSTVASEKSFNNEVGGPLTALRVEEDTRVLVAEMGASVEGDIARLVRMAPPSIGIVLTVGLAHAGEFGDIEATFRAKSEMVRDLAPTSVAVLNIDDPRVAKMAALTRARVRWFGMSDRADVWADDVTTSAKGTRFTLHADGQQAPVSFPVLGEHHVMNALAAATAALELGVTLDTIVEVLEKTTRPAKWRMEVLGGRDNITIINDAYNASPDSMAAGLKTLAQIAQPEARTVAVLGAMSELGEYSGAEHDRIGLLAVRLRISQLVIVGAEARRMHISAINEGAWDGESVFFETQDEAFDYVQGLLQPGDTVLVKSSNAAGLRHLGDRLGKEFS